MAKYMPTTFYRGVGIVYADGFLSKPLAYEMIPVVAHCTKRGAGLLYPGFFYKLTSLIGWYKHCFSWLMSMCSFSSWRWSCDVSYWTFSRKTKFIGTDTCCAYQWPSNVLCVCAPKIRLMCTTLKTLLVSLKLFCVGPSRTFWTWKYWTSL